MNKQLQTELLDLQCDSLFKEKYAEVAVLEFSKFLPSEKYFLLLHSLLRILAKFGSIYLCEQFFSSMKINKFTLGSRLTDEYLQSVSIFG